MSLTSSATTSQGTIGIPVAQLITDHFTVACLAAWPLNENEAGPEVTLFDRNPNAFLM